MAANAANKNTHRYHDGHLKSFKNVQTSLAFLNAFSRTVFLSVVELETAERIENARWAFSAKERAGALAFDSRWRNEQSHPKVAF